LSCPWSKIGLAAPKLLLPSAGLEGAPFEEENDSTKEVVFWCCLFFSKSSISERMLKNNSFDVGVRERRSGRVDGEPSMNFEGRRGRFAGDVEGDIFRLQL
jgi:hypothetical protein